MKFRMDLSNFAKFVFGVLIEITLNLEIALGRIHDMTSSSP